MNAPAVQARTPAREWVGRNLFGSPANTIMTIVFGGLLAYAAWRGVRFVFVTARWEVVRRNMTNFMVGSYPRDELWRAWTALLIIAASIGLRMGAAASLRARDPGAQNEERRTSSVLVSAWPLLFLAVVLLAFNPSAVTAALLCAVAGVAAGAKPIGARLSNRMSWLVVTVGLIVSYLVISRGGGVPFARWEGLMLTLFAAAAGIGVSFPIGVVLALGRRSTLPAVRALSVAYIELIRGVPLITLLFLSFVIGLFLPPQASTPSSVTRALVALVMFTAAYVAEIVRGGLQSVPKGQVEAAHALGLSTLATTRLIVLPQALRAVIPAMVGQFISLFKDTSLLGFIGLTELLGVAEQITSQPEFVGQGLQAETFLFASVIYWTGAYWMSKASQRLETRLGVGQR